MLNRTFGLAAAAVAGGLALSGYLMTRPDPAPVQQAQLISEVPMVAVTVPALTGDAVIGARAFVAKCAECHGANAAGIDGKAPPLVHRIYEPSHHGDMAFQLAAENGVRAHHWRFGNMPPVEGVTRAEIAAIVAYVRALQQANGIF